ncbi:MAG: [FeFe] hydrogenase H-cluster radical SAM maturase HydE [Bradymonadia bacterium]|jgi:biotin synthase
MPNTLVDELLNTHRLSRDGYRELLETLSDEDAQRLKIEAQRLCEQAYGRVVFRRGLVEFSNYCKNDCYYCGIRRSNAAVSRYRLSDDEILNCIKEGKALGFKSYVLQSGDDRHYTTKRMANLVAEIKALAPEASLTLSMGERSREFYQACFDAGCDRYLLRHETAKHCHYAKLHPKEMSLSSRLQCLEVIKSIGYQVGTGFMVGSPFQSYADLAEDLYFIQEFRPHMVGIGPFIAHHETKFADMPDGSVELTIRMIAILRIMHPKILLPATTALGTLDPDGREKAILAGANVLMPNLSPLRVREWYMIYDNKISTGDESAQLCTQLEERLRKINYRFAEDRGDSLM